MPSVSLGSTGYNVVVASSPQISVATTSAHQEINKVKKDLKLA